jgi:hypothetical protein
MDGAIVETSKAKIIRTLDSIFVEIRTVQPAALHNRPPTLFGNLHHTDTVIVIFFIHGRPALEKDSVVLAVSGRPQTNCAAFAGETSVASHAPNLLITKPHPTSDANLFPPLVMERDDEAPCGSILTFATQCLLLSGQIPA